jgi:nicotinic acetylcholine receptor
VIIEMTIVLAILTELRKNQQDACFIISHLRKWTDPNLSWDSADFGGLKQLIIPQSMIWIPKLFVYNSIDTKAMLSDNRFAIRVLLISSSRLHKPRLC